IQVGFTEVVIGRENGFGTMAVYTADLRLPTLLLSPQAGGSIVFHETITNSVAGAHLTARSGGDLDVLAGITFKAAGDLTLRADAQAAGAGTLRFAQTGHHTLRVSSGNISLQGESVIIGTSEHRAEILALD